MEPLLQLREMGGNAACRKNWKPKAESIPTISPLFHSVLRPLLGRRGMPCWRPCRAGGSLHKVHGCLFLPSFTPFPGQVVSLTQNYHRLNKLLQKTSVHPTTVIPPNSCHSNCQLHCLLPVVPSYTCLVLIHSISLTAGFLQQQLVPACGGTITASPGAACCKTGRLCNNIGAHSRHSILTYLWQLNVGLCTHLNFKIPMCL